MFIDIYLNILAYRYPTHMYPNPNILESWDNIPFEQQEKSVENIKYEVEELQFILERQSDQDCEAAMNLLFLGGIFVSLIVIKILQFHGWDGNQADF